MIEGILKGLMQWIYGLFLDLIAYCANALLGVMSTDLAFFENSVPIVPSLYQIFVAVGWGLLIGNMAFQSMKAMFAGLGIETESPLILMLRTALFGTLLIFSRDICDIGLHQLISFQGILAALHEIGKIKNGLEMIAVQALHDLCAAGRNIAEDALFIFMKQYHILLCGIIRHLFQALHHFIFTGFGIFRRHKEAEHADILAAKHLAQLHHILVGFKVGLEIIRDLDLAVGRAHRRNGDAALVEHLFCFLCLFDRQRGNVFAVHAAQFDHADARLAQGLDLFGQSRAGLIRKGGQTKLCHLSYLLSQSECFLPEGPAARAGTQPGASPAQPVSVYPRLCMHVNRFYNPPHHLQ